MEQNPQDANIIFFDPDSRSAQESLRTVLERVGEVPLLGLVLKVEVDPNGQHQVVNWMFANTNFIKSLALVLPVEKNNKTQE